jgi:hypothetical protein
MEGVWMCEGCLTLGSIYVAIYMPAWPGLARAELDSEEANLKWSSCKMFMKNI